MVRVTAPPPRLGTVAVTSTWYSCPESGPPRCAGGRAAGSRRPPRSTPRPRRHGSARARSSACRSATRPRPLLEPPERTRAGGEGRRRGRGVAGRRRLGVLQPLPQVVEPAHVEPPHPRARIIRMPRDWPRPDRRSAFLHADSLGEPLGDPRRHHHRSTPSATATLPGSGGPGRLTRSAHSVSGAGSNVAVIRTREGSGPVAAAETGPRERAGPSRLAGATSPSLGSGNPRTPSCARPVPVTLWMTRSVVIDSWGTRSGHVEGDPCTVYCAA